MSTLLRELILKATPLAELAKASDALSQADRVVALRALSGKDLARLWELAADPKGSIDLSFLVPPETPAGQTVEWMGKNSLPAFNYFTKRFTRSPDPQALTGQNTGAMEWLVGPGYFTAVRRPGVAGEILFDYTRYPAEAPKGWPPFKRNESGISRLVFADMHDYFRPIGKHLGIGAAFTSQGKFKGQYFGLARGDVLPIGF